jgi:nucleoside-diphosphate-sugar epimerase
MKLTIFGSRGFIGSHLATEAGARGLECETPERDDFESWRGRDLGHVVYAIGLTADFRQRPFDTVRAHVSRLADVLENASYETFVYLSSTRVYSGAASGEEETAFVVDPRNATDLFNLTKLTGEALVLSQAGERARVVRPANVYGPDWSSDNFLVSLIRDAVRNGSVLIRTSPESSKDYVAVGDVVSLILDVAARGTRTIYNLASGNPVSNAVLAQGLRDATGSAVTFEDGAPASLFPTIDITRIREDFGFQPRSILADLPQLVEDFRSAERG